MLTKLWVNIDAFMSSCEGVTAIEYAVIAVAVAGGAFAVFGNSGFEDALQGAMDKLTAWASGNAPT
ncbi:Flp family type IVb pilin [Marinomonas fungiae]|uniref:Flp family type IVb pilin n=1 Tax=Marinomonas fungiae TaxID=1137284 RepID=UPI003A91E21D